MSYKVLIVDDEKKTREGLGKFIDWKSMGFDVAAILADGQEAIEYLNKSPVDVVITDIKMTFVSGIDLAKYIYEHNKDTKVILLSAHKEFEYAKQALQYNVVNYLLKPISSEEIKNLFTQLKQQMDEKNKAKFEAVCQKEQMEEIITLIRKEFFTDLLLGALRSKDEIDNKAKLLNLDFDVTSCKCCTVTVKIHQYQSYVKDRWSYGRETLNTAIQNFFQSEGDNIIYFPIGNAKDNFIMLTICRNKALQENFLHTVEDDLVSITNEIKSFLGLDISSKIEKSFINIYELGVGLSRTSGTTYNIHNIQKSETDIRSPLSRQSNIPKRDISKLEEKSKLDEQSRLEEKSKLDEQIKLMATHISSGSIKMAESIFDNIIEEIGLMEIKDIRIFVINLFATIVSKMIEHDDHSEVIIVKGINYEDVFTMQNIEEIKRWGKKNIEILVKQVNCCNNTSRQNPIERSKSYIQDNYNKDITLEDVANYVYLNSAYLSRLFKKQTGENFSDYLIKVRMQKAGELLKDKRYKVNEICTMIGYDSLRYFYRLFKSYNGATPTEYRNAFWENEHGDKHI